MATSTWIPGVSPDRRAGGPDRRIAQSILSQEALARIVAETRGADSYAGRALQEFERRRAEAGSPGTGEDELVIYSLRGRWIVGTVREVREQMTAEAQAACRRRSSAAATLAEQQLAAQLPPGSGSSH